jgi:hypothetical protein
MILALLLVQQLAAQPVTPPPGWRQRPAPKIDPKTMLVDGHKPRDCGEQCEVMANMAKAMCKDPTMRKRSPGMSVDRCISQSTSEIGKMCKKSCKNGKFDEEALHQVAQDARTKYESASKRAGPGRSASPPSGGE